MRLQYLPGNLNYGTFQYLSHCYVVNRYATFSVVVGRGRRYKQAS